MKYGILFFVCLTGCYCSYTQSITYAPEFFSAKRSDGFEIVGKSGGHYVISKITPSRESLAFYNDEMKIVQEVVTGVDTKKFKVIGFNAASNGVCILTSSITKKQHLLSSTFVNSKTFEVNGPVLLDSFPVTSSGSSKFHLIKSKSGEHMALLKINRSGRLQSLLLDMLFIEMPGTTHRRLSLNIPVFAPQHNVEGIELADDGTFYFVVAGRAKDGGYIQQLVFYQLQPGSTAVVPTAIPVQHCFPERVQLFFNNRQQTCTLFSFASNTSKGNIDGVFTASVRIRAGGAVQTAFYAFTDEQKQKANNRVSRDIALNDFYFTDAVSKSGGGLIVMAECLYTAARESNINRWQRPFPDGWTSTSVSPLNFSEQSQINSIAYGSLDMNEGGGVNRVAGMYPGENLFHAENILMVAIDDQSQVTSVKFLNKMQQSNSAYEISYSGLRRTDALLLFYNDWMPNSGPLLKAVQINEQLAPVSLPVVKGLIPQYRLLNRMAVQVSNNELIIPSVRNNQFVFALIRY